MAETHTAPSETTRTVQIGSVIADQRTGDPRMVIYLDSRVVLTRDETGSTTLTPRPAFETELGTRYRVRPDADSAVDGGQYGRLRDRLAEYDGREGRKARHKADALREALDLLAGEPDDSSGVHERGTAGDGTTGTDETAGNESSDDETPDGETSDEEAPFEDIPGVGPSTAGNLRSRGIVTAGDVAAASDEVLRSIAGVGPDTLANIREFVG